MGTVQAHRPVLSISAVISGYADAFAWAREMLTKEWGPIALTSELFEFVETSFYAKSMGEKLRKQFFAFENLIDPVSLPARKLRGNQLEMEYASTHDHSVERPLNLDPGYITEAKLVLATTKDRDHRIYLSDGIYGEVTLHFHKGQWCQRPWTYPDYQRADFQSFFSECREYLRRRYRSEPAE